MRHDPATCPTCGQTVSHLDPSRLVAAISLPPQQRRLVDCLVSRFGKYVPTAALVDALYFDDPSGGPLSAKRVVHVQTFHLRKTLEPFGLVIEPDNLDRRYSRGRRLLWQHR